MSDLKTIRTLLVGFNTEISPGLVPAFRGAIIEKVGRSHSAFHNHAEEGFHYRYPLIQYKRIGKKAGLFCLGDGVDEVHHFFGLRNWKILLIEKEVDLEVDRLDLKSFKLNIWDRKFKYRIWDWLALNEENYKKYQKMEALSDKIAFLEKLLTGNILSFGKGLGWYVEKKIEVKITDIVKEKTIKYKGVSFTAFDLEFLCNVSLPDYLGLGKGVSHGYGVVKRKNDNKTK